MKKIVMILTLFAVLLTGCTANSPSLSAENIGEIWVDTMPQSEAGPHFTVDQEVIKTIVQAFNGQNLTAIASDKYEAMAGLATIVEIRTIKGEFLRYSLSGNMLTDSAGNHYTVAKPIDWQPILAQMQAAASICGTVESVEKNDGYYAALVLVDEESQNAVGDKTMLRIPEAMVSGKTPEAGDRITAYLGGPVAESYPTQSSAWSAHFSPAPDASLIHFEYGYGSYFGGYFTFTMDTTDDGQVHLVAYGSNGVDLDEDLLTDPSAMENIQNIIESHNISQWNGFDETNKDIMDGASFSLTATYDDGSTITATGYMIFPENFEEAHDELFNYLTIELLDREF